MNASEIAKLLKSHKEDGTVFYGLRGLYANEELGEMNNSLVWEDGEMTDETLDGTCVIYLGERSLFGMDDSDIQELENKLNEVISDVKSYGDGRIGLVAGDDVQAGEDVNEGIIYNAELIHIWN